MAEKTLTSGRLNFLIEQRPYVTIENISMIKDANGNDAISVVFTNSGKTPAINFAFAPADLHPFVGNIPATVTVSDELAHSVLGSDKSTNYTLPFTLKEETQKRFNAGETAFTIRGTARYSDIFGCEHWTEFCMEYKKAWNEFRYCGASIIDPANVLAKTATLEAQRAEPSALSRQTHSVRKWQMS